MNDEEPWERRNHLADEWGRYGVIHSSAGTIYPYRCPTCFCLVEHEWLVEHDDWHRNGKS